VNATAPHKDDTAAHKTQATGV